MDGLKSCHAKMTYQAVNGASPPAWMSCGRVGWRDDDFGGYRPGVTDSGSRFCVAMLPRESAAPPGA